MICKNCNTDFEGNFCYRCGQKNLNEGFTVKEILYNFFNAFTHVDSGILYLVKELLIRPGFVARDYILGGRKKYYNPLQFLIIAVAIATFLAINFSLFGPQVNPDSLINISPLQRYFIQFNNFIYKYFNVLLFLSVPIASLYSWLFFKKAGFNFAENLIFNTFIAGERTVMYIALTPLLYFTKEHWYIGIGIYYLLWNIYFIVAFNQFFGGNKITTSLKYLLVLILMFATSQGLSMAIFTLFFYK